MVYFRLSIVHVRVFGSITTCDLFKEKDFVVRSCSWKSNSVAYSEVVAFNKLRLFSRYDLECESVTLSIPQ